MKKILATAIIVVLIAGLFFAIRPFSIRPANATLPDNYIAIMDAGLPVKGNLQMDCPTSDPDPVPYYNIGDHANFVYANFYDGNYYSTSFTLMGISAHGELWIRTAGLAWPAGDPRPTPVIYANETAFLLNEFETLIYPTDVAYFGAPAVRDGNYSIYPAPPGMTGSSRVIILVMNIRDENYYDPTYPYYVAGYFSPTVSAYADRNIVTIDSYAWERRLGAAGTQWIDGVTVNRPYVYDSTLAHEFQHLIHADWNPGDDTFMNEGCSMYAEFLCGFGIDPSYINSYLYTPDNSLTVWGDQGDINILADYGAAAMFLIYLNDHYGGAPTISYFVQDGIGGIDGVNNALAHFGYKHTTFDDVFHDWRLANLIHTDFPGCRKYNYQSINLNDPAYIPLRVNEIGGLPVPVKRGTDFGNTFTILGYDTGVSQVASYGSDYISFENWSRPGFIYFDGDDTSTLPTPSYTPWTLTSDGWYSGTGVNLADGYLASNVYVNPSDPTLTLVTAWGLESYWDFGFVQVSTDGGKTLTSLSNAYTTYDHDPAALPAIIASLPGLTDYNPDWTSVSVPPESTDYTTMSFDLAAYAGMNVLVVFHYMTDWATTYEGWWIKSATVSGTALTLANWTPPPPTPPPVKFQVTLVQTLTVCKKTLYIPWDMRLNAANKGMGVGFAAKPDVVILVVTPITDAGTADYQFQATKLPLFRFC